MGTSPSLLNENNKHKCSTATRGSFTYSLPFHAFFSVPVCKLVLLTPDSAVFSRNGDELPCVLGGYFFARRGGSPAEVDPVPRPLRQSPPAHVHQGNQLCPELTQWDDASHMASEISARHTRARRVNRGQWIIRSSETLLRGTGDSSV